MPQMLTKHEAITCLPFYDNPNKIANASSKHFDQTGMSSLNMSIIQEHEYRLYLSYGNKRYFKLPCKAQLFALHVYIYVVVMMLAHFSSLIFIMALYQFQT